MIGIGVDLCEVDRMRAALARTPTLRIRVFTEAASRHELREREPTLGFCNEFA